MQTATGTDTTLIEWIKLAPNLGAVSGGSNVQTIMSLQGLDAVQWNSTGLGNDWSKSYCDIHNWRNGTFYNTFTDTQKAAIAQTLLTTNQYNSSVELCTTLDYVFLLSYEEASAMSDLLCIPTAFALTASTACYQGLNTRGCYWWLRSPSGGSSYATTVSVSGNVRLNGYSVSSTDGAARPVLNLML